MLIFSVSVRWRVPACLRARVFNPDSDAKEFGDVDSKVKEALESPERAAALARRQAE